MSYCCRYRRAALTPHSRRPLSSLSHISLSPPSLFRTHILFSSFSVSHAHSLLITSHRRRHFTSLDMTRLGFAALLHPNRFAHAPRVSLSLSLSHTHTHTLTHSLIHSLTQAPPDNAFVGADFRLRVESSRVESRPAATQLMFHQSASHSLETQQSKQNKNYSISLRGKEMQCELLNFIHNATVVNLVSPRHYSTLPDIQNTLLREYR